MPGELPQILTPLVQAFGESQVRGAGQSLGYPATWVTDFTEVAAVVRHIAKGGLEAMKLDCTQMHSEDEARSSFVLPGRYHVAIQSADDSFTTNQKAIIVAFEILNGTVPGQEGKKHTEFFSISEKAVKRVQLFCLAAGLVRPGETRDVNFAVEAPGKQLVIELEEREYEKKDGTKGKGVRMTFGGMWSLTHPDVADVPKDKEMMAIAAKLQAAGLVAALATAPAPDAPASVATPKHTPAESESDPWANV